MGRIEQSATRSLIYAARLHSNETILDEIDAADSMPARDLVECRENGNRIEKYAVDRNRSSLAEANGNFLRLAGCELG